MSKLTHQDAEGRVRMVDVGDKPVTARRAVASARVEMNAEAFAAIRDGAGPKGDALKTAELAGIMAAKRTAELIPLCHPLPLTRRNSPSSPMSRPRPSGSVPRWPPKAGPASRWRRSRRRAWRR